MEISSENQYEAVFKKPYPEWARREIVIPDISLGEIIDRSTTQYADRVAISFYGREITYAELRNLVDNMAGYLSASGIKKGDRIALMLPNIPHFAVFFFAVAKVGGIVVQTNPLYTPIELKHQIEDSGATTIVVLDDFVDKALTLYPKPITSVIVTRAQDFLPPGLGFMYSLISAFKRTGKKVKEDGNIRLYRSIMKKDFPPANPVDINTAEDPMVFQYTGGTTGVPKAAVLTHKNLVSNVYQVTEWVPPKYRDGISYLSAIPFFHVYGMMTAMLTPLATGCKIIMIPDPRDTNTILKTIQREKPDSFPGIPAMYHSFLAHKDIAKYDISSLKFCLSGAAPLPKTLQDPFEARTGAVIIEGYGLSEASPVTNANPLDPNLRRIGSIGPPVPNTHEKVVDLETGTKEVPLGQPGELIINGPQVMKGFWNNSEEIGRALRDGWLYTGDIAKVDADGYVYIIDRKKDIIIAGGYNVYPNEVEDVIRTYPKVEEVAVVGEKDEHRGETVKAFIVLKQGQQATQEEIVDHCRQYLAVYKLPRIIEFRDSLPKSLIGKVLRRQLRSH